MTTTKNFSFMSSKKSTFYLIIQILLKKNKREHIRVNQFIHNNQYEYFKAITLQFYNSKSKMKEFGSFIINNVFMKDCDKEAFCHLFFKSQFYYYKLNNLVRKYKYRESKIKIVNDKDLLMCEMTDYKDNIKTIINDSGIFYLFKISDLINIINKSLSNSPSYYFFEPKELKNPYNNNKFSLSNLYNIYFAIKSSTYTMPIIYQLYFDYNFDFKRLLVEGECIMKDVIIDNKIKSLDKNDLIRYIKDMLYDQHFFGPIIKSIDIHAKFPPDVLINVMKPFYVKYTYSKYSINNAKKTYYADMVKRKMIAFIKKNPMFGRKYIRGLKNRNQDDILNAEISNMFIFGLDENSHNYTGKDQKFYTHIDKTFDDINISNIYINESLLLNDPYSFLNPTLNNRHIYGERHRRSRRTFQPSVRSRDPTPPTTRNENIHYINIPINSRYPTYNIDPPFIFHEETEPAVTPRRINNQISLSTQQRFMLTRDIGILNPPILRQSAQPTPTQSPSTPPPFTPPLTLTPSTPVPSTPVPSTPVPSTPTPIPPFTLEPSTPVPSTPVPSTPVPSTPVPSTPTPIPPLTLAPITQTPPSQVMPSNSAPSRDIHFSNSEEIREFLENVLEGTNAENDVYNAASALVNSIIDSDRTESENNDTDNETDNDNESDNETDNEINNGFIYNDSDSSNNSDN